MLAGCKAESKTFTGAGVSITLNDSFVEKEVVQAPLYLGVSRPYLYGN